LASGDSAGPRDVAAGEWWGGEIRAVGTLLDRHKLIFGAEFQDNLQQRLKYYTVGSPPDYDTPYRSTRYGFYIQDEYRPWDDLVLFAGARYDFNPLGGASANPRIGAIWQARQDTTLKLMYGTAFRAPNVVEKLNTNRADGSNAFGIKPETIETLEFVADHFFTPATRASVSAYRYRIDQLIGPNADEYSANLGSAQGYGVELEGEQRFQNGVRGRLSYVYQRSDDDGGRDLTNSPHHQVKLNLSLPLWGERWRAGFESQYLSSRGTIDGKVGDYLLGNLSFIGDLHRNLQFSVGLYNLFNTHYADPVGPSFLQDSVFQDGRSFRLKLNLRF
jgi:iron complex outermembrane receptor protein